MAGDRVLVIEQNAIVSREQLEITPSRRDDIPEDLEDDLRNIGCELIQSAGILLRLPQAAMATAQVLFQRFFYMASLRKYGIKDIGMGSLFLASKIEECMVRIRDLINVYYYLIRRLKKVPAVEPMDQFSQIFYDMKNAMIVSEMHILKRLGFDVHVRLPYGLMFNYLQVLELESHKELPQRAWNYLNDGLRTNIYVCYQPPTIASAVIWLAARELGVKLPTNPPWWEVFDTTLEDMQVIAIRLKRLYLRLPQRNLPLSVEEMEQYLTATYGNRRDESTKESAAEK
ncbi:uncharacterized protein VTP21DRAFT_11561 [Calcarisporiella thermophila]|uniref:uncharacterized protein n=1 Tax=Calcarisporiella thermophila TaxID=911321 RepID=UPI0037427F63